VPETARRLSNVTPNFAPLIVPGTVGDPSRLAISPVVEVRGPTRKSLLKLLGLSTRTRTKNEAVNGGTACRGDPTESLPCNIVRCANGPVDCSWNDWSPWGECSKTCGGGTTRRSRTSNAAQNGGASCEGGPEDTGRCNTQDCPADCVWGPWSPFSDCRFVPF
jgi:hemicentin